MFAHIRAQDAAVGSVAARTSICPSDRSRALLAIALAVVTLAGCMPQTPLTGADPADPQARVAATGYRSTVAPYQSLRPSAPAPWRELNDRVAPPAKSAE